MELTRYIQIKGDIPSKWQPEKKLDKRLYILSEQSTITIAICPTFCLFIYLKKKQLRQTDPAIQRYNIELTRMSPQDKNILLCACVVTVCKNVILKQSKRKTPIILLYMWYC